MRLTDRIEKHFKRMKLSQKSALKKLGLRTIGDMLYHIPLRFTDMAELKAVSRVTDGDVAVMYGSVSGLKVGKTWKRKIPSSRAVLTDMNGGKVELLWLNQPYIHKMIKENSYVKVSGRVSCKNGKKTMINPFIEHTDNLPIDVSDSLFEGDRKRFGLPVYALSRGISSAWFYWAIKKILNSVEDLDDFNDPLPNYVRKALSLPDLKTAFFWVHLPRDRKTFEAGKKRFAFEEIFCVQVGRHIERKKYEQNYNQVYKIDRRDVDDFVSRLPFELTDDQKKVIDDIYNDIVSGSPMMRFVQGDVGSGKTVVAGTIASCVVNNKPNNQNFGFTQVLYMVPTEILAIQLFDEFIKYFRGGSVQIGLLTGKTCRKFPSKVNPDSHTNISKSQLKKWIANGEIGIIIGTHSLISESVVLKHLGLVIVDEQHRFGIKQRGELIKKAKHSPHFLSMSATPIPRTLALTIYGDLDISVIKTMPKGRKKVKTKVCATSDRKNIYEEIKKELRKGRQMYVVCPRIDDGDNAEKEMSPAKKRAMLATSVERERVRIEENFGDEFVVDALHGRMKKSEKEEIMGRFLNGDTDILISTSVIEVGVNVVNASVIIIEGAERFGMAQLHQLRGRVVRGSHQPYCYLFVSEGVDMPERIVNFADVSDGFELAEYDLMNRGAGMLIGNKQWGISDVAMEALRNVKLVEYARNYAREIVDNDMSLENFPALKSVVFGGRYDAHFE